MVEDDRPDSADNSSSEEIASRLAHERGEDLARAVAAARDELLQACQRFETKVQDAGKTVNQALAAQLLQSLSERFQKDREELYERGLKVGRAESAEQLTGAREEAFERGKNEARKEEQARTKQLEQEAFLRGQEEAKSQSAGLIEEEIAVSFKRGKEEAQLEIEERLLREREEGVKIGREEAHREFQEAEERWRTQVDEAYQKGIRENAKNVVSTDVEVSEDLLLDLDRIQSATTLPFKLTALLEAAAKRVTRCAVFVIKEGIALGYQSRGFGDGDPTSADPIRRVRIPLNADTILGAAASSRKPAFEVSRARLENNQIFSPLGSREPDALFAIPLLRRGSPVSFLYADSGAGDPKIERSFHLMSLLLRFLEKDLEILLLKPAGSAGSVSPEGRGTEKRPRPSTAPQAPTATVNAPAPEPPAAESEPQSPPMPPPAQERTEPTESTSAEEVSASTEPLSQAFPTDDPHEQAQRFARLIVNEIKLYNLDKVAEGRRNADLYQRLKDDIERGRRLYEGRVPPEVSGGSDYYNQELIRVLAGGDSSVLGTP